MKIFLFFRQIMALFPISIDSWSYSQLEGTSDHYLGYMGQKKAVQCEYFRC